MRWGSHESLKHLYSMMLWTGSKWICFQKFSSLKLCRCYSTFAKASSDVIAIWICYCVSWVSDLSAKVIDAAQNNHLHYAISLSAFSNSHRLSTNSRVKEVGTNFLKASSQGLGNWFFFIIFSVRDLTWEDNPLHYSEQYVPRCKEQGFPKATRTFQNASYDQAKPGIIVMGQLEVFASTGNMLRSIICMDAHIPIWVNSMLFLAILALIVFKFTWFPRPCIVNPFPGVGIPWLKFKCCQGVWKPFTPLAVAVLP